MAGATTTITSTSPVYGPYLSNIYPNAQQIEYVVRLYNPPSPQPLIRYGLLDLCWADDTSGLNAVQLDFCTWYGYGVTRTFVKPYSDRSIWILRLWPDSNLIGFTVEWYIARYAPQY